MSGELTIEEIRDLMRRVLLCAIKDATAFEPGYGLVTGQTHDRYVARAKRLKMRPLSFEDYVATKQYHHRNAVVAWSNKKKRALEWVNSDDESHAFSFVNVCLTIGLRPSRVREKIMQYALNTHARKQLSEALYAREKSEGVAEDRGAHDDRKAREEVGVDQGEQTAHPSR